ncbi:MAG: hypothetical protein SPH79_05170 [Schaalia hyovaginalis]|uniref:hypothetical protein n=1 Tax=Schaalia hyovaginalis TaxID=29316 RepID=UPI002A90B429|nr:hypothetical protein [Schaalia hyovaginalis]MDY5600367.1 hypothetical protein [Schaalia hyovaginalis]MDY6213858.1 hypothetical protein [Schaalia hyovaginalis]
MRRSYANTVISASIIALLVELLAVIGTIVLALSAGRRIAIPHLIGAAPGTGAELLSLTIEPIGAIGWFAVTAGVFTLFGIIFMPARTRNDDQTE